MIDIHHISDPEEKPDRRQIIIQSEAQATTEALGALAGHRDLFQRDGSLVRPFLPNDPAISPVLLPATGPSIREILSRRAEFLKPLSRGDLRSVLVPDWLPAIILDRRDWPEVPHLRGVVETPVFLPDGRVLSDPGLDERSGLYLAPLRKVTVQVPPAPGLHEAQAALDLLWEAVEDFPWAAEPSPETHRAAWLAFLLTLVGRYAIDGPVPFALVNASTRGSGKGLLVKLTSLIACGRIATTGAASAEEEELRKGIFSALLAGERLTWLDEVPTPWGGRTWNGLVTSWPSYADRVLGKSERRTAPALTTWVVSGNNLGTKPDTARRALAIRLEPDMEEPETRSGFHHADLLAWAGSNQPRLLAAALTILKAFHHVGSPEAPNTSPVGSFEAWSRLVRDAVHWVTGLDVMGTQKVLGVIADEDRSAWRRILSELFSTFGDTTFTARDVLAKIQSQASLDGKALTTECPNLADGFELLKTTRAELSARTIGHILNRHLGTVASGQRLVNHGKGKEGLVFQVKAVKPASGFSPSEPEVRHSRHQDHLCPPVAQGAGDLSDESDVIIAYPKISPLSVSGDTVTVDL